MASDGLSGLRRWTSNPVTLRRSRGSIPLGGRHIIYLSYID